MNESAKMLIVAMVTSLILIFLSVTRVPAEMQPPVTSGGKDQLSDLQNIYDERIKQLEGRVSLLTQRDEEITTLISATKSIDPNTLMKAVSDAATRAIGAATEAVRHIENFYSNTITTLGIALTALGIVGGFFGIRQFKEAANTLLDKEVAKFKVQLDELNNKFREDAEAITRLRKNIAAVITDLRKNTAVVVDDAKRNNEALIIISASHLIVTNCILQLRKEETNATAKGQLVAGLASSLINMNSVIDVDKPKDDAILVWALTIRGTIFHLRDEFERALKDFESALAVSPDRGPTLYNAACSACRLQLKEKALTYCEGSPDTASSA